MDLSDLVVNYRAVSAEQLVEACKSSYLVISINILYKISLIVKCIMRLSIRTLIDPVNPCAVSGVSSMYCMLSLTRNMLSDTYSMYNTM